MEQGKRSVLALFLILNGLLLLLLILYCLLVFCYNNGYLPLFFKGCGFKDVLGIYCPGCGGTRALGAILHGRILKSVIYNPAVVLGALLIIYYDVRAMLSLITGNAQKYLGRINHRFLIAYPIVILAYAVLRDILLICFKIDLVGDIL